MTPSRLSSVAAVGSTLLTEMNVDAVVCRARQASDRVVDDGNVGGVYLGDANVGANVAAWAPHAMWGPVGERGLKHIDGTTEDSPGGERFRIAE